MTSLKTGSWHECQDCGKQREKQECILCDKSFEACPECDKAYTMVIYGTLCPECFDGPEMYEWDYDWCQDWDKNRGDNWEDSPFVEPRKAQRRSV